MQKSRGNPLESFPPQSAASVRQDVLWTGEGYRPLGGYSGAQQYQHDADLYHGVWGDPPAAAGEDAAGTIKKKTTELLFRSFKIWGRASPVAI